jgi:hypothetical protein
MATGKRAKGRQELQQALSVAQSQGSKADEARTVAILARLDGAQSASRKVWSGRLAALRAFFGRLASR